MAHELTERLEKKFCSTDSKYNKDFNNEIVAYMKELADALKKIPLDLRTDDVIEIAFGLSEPTLEELMHIWYLEATKGKLNPESYNLKAQKPYCDLTDEQKSIDKYIANKCREHFKTHRSELE